MEQLIEEARRRPLLWNISLEIFCSFVVQLKYYNKSPVINDIARVSKPGCRYYSNYYTILKNRKFMGTLQYHRIAQRGSAQKKKTLIEEVKTSELGCDIPRFRIIREPPQGNPELLTVQVHVKDVVSSKSLLLDVGEDRLVLRSSKKAGSLLDIFLPYSIDQESTCAHFDLENQILSVEMPVTS